MTNKRVAAVVHSSGPAKPWHRAAGGSWPEMKNAFGGEKQLLRDPNSDLSQAIDKWWACFADDDDAIRSTVKELDAKPQPKIPAGSNISGTTPSRAALAQLLTARKPTAWPTAASRNLTPSPRSVHRKFRRQ